jgi:hypothetical protein
MQNFNRITIQKNKKSQKEPLENISKDSSEFKLSIVVKKLCNSGDSCAAFPLKNS